MNDLLAIAPEVFDVIPGLQVVVVVARDIATPQLEAVDARWSATWSRVHLDALASPLELRLSRPGDIFEGLDASTSEAVPPGELAYAAGDSVVTRQLVWRQSRLGLVTAATRSALFLSELLPSHAGLAEVVQHALVTGLQDLFGASVHSAVLSHSTPALSRWVAEPGPA